jgi:hypothetical protein
MLEMAELLSLLVVNLVANAKVESTATIMITLTRLVCNGFVQNATQSGIRQTVKVQTLNITKAALTHGGLVQKNLYCPLWLCNRLQVWINNGEMK